MTAVMQTPSRTEGVPLELTGPVAEGEQGVSLTHGQTFARIARFDLREEGTHILQPTVTYNETTISPDGTAASGGRVRTFRKLYQFVAQQLLSVRTKAQSLLNTGSQPGQKGIEYVLEAQIENMGDIMIVLEDVKLLPKPHLVAQGMNLWDMLDLKDSRNEKLHLGPGEIQQVCFLVKEIEGHEEREASVTRDGRTVLGQLSINWRGPMGEVGSLSTGWLSTRRR